MPTKQETFDIVVRHLLKQGAKSIDETLICRYRGPNGSQCAVGCLIPDERYSERMEETTLVTELGFTEVGLLMQELGHCTDLCLQLQKIHDCEPPDSWLFELQELAKREGLKFPEVEGVADDPH